VLLAILVSVLFVVPSALGGSAGGLDPWASDVLHRSTPAPDVRTEHSASTDGPLDPVDAPRPAAQRHPDGRADGAFGGSELHERHSATCRRALRRNRLCRARDEVQLARRRNRRRRSGRLDAAAGNGACNPQAAQRLGRAYLALARSVQIAPPAPRAPAAACPLTETQAPDLEFRSANEALELEKSGVSYQHVPPGYRLPYGHAHKKQEDVYVVLRGSGRMTVDDEIVELKEGTRLGTRTDPAKRTRLIATLFDRVVAGRRHDRRRQTARTFLPTSRLWTNSRNLGLSSGVSRAGATGLEPALYPHDPRTNDEVNADQARTDQISRSRIRTSVSS
jgi:hypothetical protein